MLIYYFSEEDRQSGTIRATATCVLPKSPMSETHLPTMQMGRKVKFNETFCNCLRYVLIILRESCLVILTFTLFIYLKALDDASRTYLTVWIKIV